MAWLSTDWTWRVLSPFLNDDDAISLSLYAMEARHRSLWRFFLYDDATATRRPLDATRLLHVAIANGCWRAASTMHHELLRERYDAGKRDLVSCDLSTLREQFEKHGLRSSTPFASFLRRVHFAPVKIPTHVVYEACRRGHLDAVIWLREVSSYEPYLAAEWAAKGKHMDIVRWVLTYRKAAKRRHDGIKITWTLKGKEAKALGGFYAWNVHIPHDRTTYAYCASREHGLLPRKTVKNAKTLYPLKTWAASEGDSELFERLHEQACGRDMSTTEAVIRAAECGQLAIVQWFFEIERPVHKDIEEVTLAALAHGHLHIVQWLYEEDFEIELPMASRLSVRANGFLELHQWINETFPDPKIVTKMRNERTPLWDNFLIEAARKGLLDVVEFLHEEVGCAISIRALGDAATYGHLSVLQWLWSKQPPSDADLRFVLSRAVSGGSLDVVQWLVGDVGLFGSSLLKLAVSEGHVDVAAYLLEVAQDQSVRNNVPLHMILDFDVDLVFLISDGRFGVVDWLLSNVRDVVMRTQEVDKFAFFLTLERYHDENDAALQVRNTEFDHKRLFQWSIVAAQPRDKVRTAVERLLLALPAGVCQASEWIPRWAIKTQSKPVLQALAEMGHGSLFWYRHLALLLESTRDLTLVQWYLEHEDAASLVEEEAARIARWAANYNHTDLLLWLFRRSEELATFRTAAWTAAKHGHVRVLQTIARCVKTQGLSIHMDFCDRIWRGIDTIAAQNGHVSVIDWLWERTGSKSSLADVAAKHGQVSVLQWLEDKDKALAQCSVRAFCSAVGRGHAEPVTWLMRHQSDVVDQAMDAVASLEAAVETLLTTWKA